MVFKMPDVTKSLMYLRAEDRYGEFLGILDIEKHGCNMKRRIQDSPEVFGLSDEMITFH